MTPSVNGALLEIRYVLGNGAGAYTLPNRLMRLYRGAGTPDRIVGATHKIYMGDANTRDNPIGIEVRCSADATVQNAGSVITVLARG